MELERIGATLLLCGSWYGDPVIFSSVVLEGLMYGELSQARSLSVFELRSSFNVPIERLALLETMLSIDGVRNVLSGRGGDSAINFSFVKVQ